MLLNKSQVKILGIFAGHITEQFTLREIARNLKMHVSQVHRTIQPLIKNNLIKQGKYKHLTLNYKKNHEILAYVEYYRKVNFLKQYSTIRLFAEDVINKIKEDSFILLIFGSAVNTKKPRDIDVLLIVDETSKVEFNERLLFNIGENFTLPFEEIVIGFESVYEMLAKRDQMNVMNEILNKHIILHGAELFYRFDNKRKKIK